MKMAVKIMCFSSLKYVSSKWDKESIVYIRNGATVLGECYLLRNVW